MIKGVNKQVLEVTNTENPYFEKIVFFVRAEHENDERKVLVKEAREVAKKHTKPPKTRRSKREIRNIFLLSGVCSGVGIAITFLISSLL